MLRRYGRLMIWLGDALAVAVVVAGLSAAGPAVGPANAGGSSCSMHEQGGAGTKASADTQHAMASHDGAANAGGAIAAAMKQAVETDPVSGKKVKDKEAPIAIFLDRVYKFASAENLAKFRAAPEQYATTACPVSGEAVRIKDAKVKTQWGGRTWYFCCADCKVKFEPEPTKYATYRCPTCGGVAPVSMGEPVLGTFDGHQVRFCCEGCRDDFEGSAAGYFSIVVPEGGAVQATPTPASHQ